MNPGGIMSDVTIPEDIRAIAEKALNAAHEEHDALFNPLSNSISEGLWKRFVEHSARAILAERERAAKIADEHAKARTSKEFTATQAGRLTARSIAFSIRSPHE